MNNLKPSLSSILVKDLQSAKSQEFVPKILEPGTYSAKILGFTEEDTYQYITVEINKEKYNFFYNYFIKNTTDLNADVINWIKALATIPVDENTTLLEIANSAIGSTYSITIYNYVSRSGKNAGKTQHAISFKDLPVIETTVIETEEFELPY
jgi:membrane-bound inhibitor of C-type lysozyme